MKPLMLAVLISACLPTAFAKEAAARLPTLAVTVSAQALDASSRENVEDLLLLELGNQPFLQLVDRRMIEAVMKEHAIALSNRGDMKNAIALGKFVGADFLLRVLAENNKAAIRLVEVATGQVKLEQEVALAADLALSAAAIREKVLAAVKPESQAANRLAVGIAAFPNRSGTDRSDKLGVEMQAALRKRLRQEAWAVVLERQYPTALLEEVDLARTSLVRDKAIERLPPADLVILGTMQDVGREYVANQPWPVTLDLTFRLRGQSRQISQTCRSDAVEAAADGIVRKVDEFRRQPASRTAVPEKELWRRQAMYLMPRSANAVGREPHFSSSEREKLDTAEMIRAWENVLLLDADDMEARLNLGICLVSLYKDDILVSKDDGRKRLAVDQCLRGSRLVEVAARARPGGDELASFYLMAECLRVPLPQRSAEMFDYIVAHPDLFPVYVKWAKMALAGLRPSSIAAAVDDAVRNVQKDPDRISGTAFQMLNGNSNSPDTVLEIAAKYTASGNPLVRFYFELATAEVLLRNKKDPAALEHFDRAIAAHEGAFAACKYNHLAVDDIYRRKIVACEVLNKPELLRQTALQGARHFMSVGRFNQSVQGIYVLCATKVLVGKGDETEALAICNEYLAAAERNPSMQNDDGPRIIERREELSAKIGGASVPGLGGLRLASGTKAFNLRAPRVAAAGGRVWLAWQAWQSGGPALVYSPDLDATRKLPDLPVTMRSVAAMNDAVFFGGLSGLYRLDTGGKLIRHYSRKDGSLPADHIVDLCQGGGKIYLCFRGADQYGVAMLDPATDRVSVLAPSSREANLAAEPISFVYRVWWDADNSRLYASDYLRFASTAYPTHQCVWMQKGKAWQRYSGEEGPRLVVSQGDEALLVQIKGKQTQFRFLKAGTTVPAEVPLPWLMGERAWDDHRIWAPTYTGLYEIDRATGRITWLARQTDNPFLSALRQDDRLYVATSRGLYYRDIPATTVK